MKHPSPIFFLMNLFSLFVLTFWSYPNLLHASEKLQHKIPVYGVIKPTQISTNVSIGQGLVHNIPFELGDSVRQGQTLIEILEKETLRGYKSTITGKVAKIHVTKGAAISVGMPLITVVDPKSRQIEISLSPDDARMVKTGTQVVSHKDGSPVGVITKISSIIDPDSGAVTASMNSKLPNHLIGEVISLDLIISEKACDKVVTLSELGQYTKKWNVQFISGNKTCLKKIN